MGLSTTYTKTETDYLLQKLESELASGLKGKLAISDTAPTAQGLYILSDVGTYTNLGGIVTTAGKLNYAYFNGSTWSLIAVDLPQPISLSGNYNSANEIEMFNISESRYFFDAKSYLQWARIDRSGELNRLHFNVKYKAGLNVIVKKFSNKNDFTNPVNNGILILEKEITTNDYNENFVEGKIDLNTEVNEGELIGAFFYFNNITDKVTFEHFYFNGNPHPDANNFFWTNNDNKILEPSVISSSYSYYEIPLRLENLSEEQKSIKEIENKLSSQKARIVLPKKLWAIVGKEFNIYFDAIALLPDTGSESPNYIFSILCPLGGTTNNRFTLTPDAWMIGQHVFIVQVFDNFGNKLEEKECQLNIVEAKNPTQVKNILCIGDSTTDDTAEVIRHLKNNFNSFTSGISPRLVGHKPLFGEEHLNHGASSGKTFDFFANGMTVLKFNVNGLPTSNIGVYPNLTMSLMDGSGYLVAILSHLNGDGTGYIIANIWNNGSQTIGAGFTGNLATNGAAGFPTQLNVTSTVELQNWSPLRLNGSLSFQDYENYIGYPIDLLSIDLGINDSRGLVQPRNVRDSILDNIFKIVNAYKTYKPNGKVMLCLPKSCSNPRSKNSLHHDTYRINIHNLREDIINNFDGNTNYPNVFVCYSGLAMDRKWGYPSNIEQVGARYAQTKRIISDDLHPINEGYAQIADAMTATIIGNL